MFIQCDTIASAKRELIQAIREEGYEQHIEKGSFEKEATYRRQVPNVLVDIMTPQEKFDKPAHVTDLEIRKYAATLVDPDCPKNADYTYGERIADQIQEVIAMMSYSKNTNQGVIEVGAPEDILLKNPPCLRLIQFMFYEEKLNMSVYFRSNDIESAFLMNMYGLAELQNIVAMIAGLEPGKISYMCAGAHIYIFGG